MVESDLTSSLNYKDIAVDDFARIKSKKKKSKRYL